MSATTSANGVQTGASGDPEGAAPELREDAAAATRARIRSNYPTGEGEGPGDGPDSEVRALLAALPEGVTTARDLFEAAAEASRDAAALRRRLERMESGEGVRAASLARSSSGGRADVNGMGRVNARIDLEAVTRSRVEADYALIDLACAVLWGPTGEDGAASLGCQVAADVVWHHYLAGETWESAARGVGMSASSARRECARLFDLVDALGPMRAMLGRGDAY